MGGCLVVDDVKGTSEKLLLFIQGNPGCHLRRIRTIMGVSMGTVQYQLDKLEKMGKVTSSRRGLYKYYFPAGLFNENEIDDHSGNYRSGGGNGIRTDDTQNTDNASDDA
jgi:predicted transcriptional regulator